MYILLELQNFLPNTTLELLIEIDENISHIIGCQWHKIDYSSENMKLQGRRAKYACSKYSIFQICRLQKLFNS
ncbi:hypothetical protein [Rickettsia oklahomensis]|uniref:Uncharacterized protein n=1 Tax=Rickettsia oklahomensis TaxID=3141789 RepID=A0AAU7BYY6_9RICK